MLNLLIEKHSYELQICLEWGNCWKGCKVCPGEIPWTRAHWKGKLWEWLGGYGRKCGAQPNRDQVPEAGIMAKEDVKKGEKDKGKLVGYGSRVSHSRVWNSQLNGLRLRQTKSRTRPHGKVQNRKNIWIVFNLFHVTVLGVTYLIKNKQTNKLVTL